MGWRLAVAFVLRLVVAVCIGLAVVFLLFTAVGFVQMLGGNEDLRDAEKTLAVGACIGLAFAALARLAHMAVGLFVDRSK